MPFKTNNEKQAERVGERLGFRIGVARETRGYHGFQWWTLTDRTGLMHRKMRPNEVGCFLAGVEYGLNHNQKGK